ncbi:MAG: hypothetical protein LBM25_07190 [Bacteroidales bacterium]|jgi:hypothetical protein|nr:hypothetical protein [Bacteroidales bacterium]
MNTFQEQLNEAIKNINKVVENIVNKDNFSLIEKDILLEKLRKAYQLVALSDFNEESTSSILEVEKEIVIEKDNEEEIHYLGNEEEVFKEEEESLIKEEEDKKEEEAGIIYPICETIEEKEVFKEEEEVLVKEEELLEKEEEENKEEEKVVESLDKEVIEENKEEKENNTPSILEYLNKEVPKISETLFEQKKKTIAEKFEQGASLFDTINTKQQDLSDRFNHNLDLIKSIGVNEKFMFINDLFSGDIGKYTEFIKRLNQVQNKEEAFQILQQTKEKYHWVETAYAYTTLKEIINKKCN